MLGTFQLSRWRVVSIKTIGRKIDFVENRMAKSKAFFRYYLYFQFYTSYQILICEKQFLALKKFSFMKLKFQKRVSISYTVYGKLK